MAIDFTENELMEMKRKAIVQARDMHRRAFLVSPAPESPKTEAVKPAAVPPNPNSGNNTDTFKYVPVEPQTQTQTNQQMPVRDEESVILQKDNSQTAPQNIRFQNNSGRNQVKAKPVEPVRSSAQPPAEKRASPNMQDQSRTNPSHNGRANMPAQSREINTVSQHSTIKENDLPPPMRPQSRPLLNLGGLFNGGFRNYPPPKEIFKHEEENSQETPFCPPDCPVKKSFSSGLFNNMKGMDNDMLLILGLILLLSNEGSDQMLVFALLYILL